eukprot:scaffold343_cov245-Pinguiococcus_pyrenoidosus.AAC.19
MLELGLKDAPEDAPIPSMDHVDRGSLDQSPLGQPRGSPAPFVDATITNGSRAEYVLSKMEDGTYYGRGAIAMLRYCPEPINRVAVIVEGEPGQGVVHGFASELHGTPD